MKQLVHVTYSPSKTEIGARELEAFEVAASELKYENLLAITWDYEGTTSIGDQTLTFIPIWKWLLKQQ